MTPATKPADKRITEGKAWDWRESYIICEHVEQDEKQGTRHRGFRVCCEACYPNFLLVDEDKLERTERGPLCIGKVKP